MHNFCSPSSAESHPPTPCYRPQTAKLNISAKLEEKKKKPPHAGNCYGFWPFLLLSQHMFSSVIKLLSKNSFGSWVAKKLELTTQFWTNFVNQGERGVDNVLQKCFILLE